MTGKIVKLISNLWTVEADNKKINCTSKGKFRHLKVSPLVGDIVEFDPNDKVILSIHKRKNELVRPPIANVDQAIILTSCVQPNFSSNLLDKMLVIIEYNNIKPVICFTKYDLLNDTKEIDNIISYYKKIGYDVFINSQVDKIKQILKDKTSVLTGQTGVGKSSLLNRLEKELNLPTGEISKALGRGRHTTRHVELFEIYGGYIADTPGFSSLDLTQVDKDLLASKISVFKPYIGECRFNNCMHINEPDCKVKEAVGKGKIKQSFHKTYKDIIEFIISENLKGNRHRTLK